MFTDQQWGKIFDGTGLTERRKEIVKLALSGLSEKQIAIRIERSPKTVGSAMREVFRVLKVSDIRELFRWVIERFLDTHEQRNANA